MDWEAIRKDFSCFVIQLKYVTNAVIQSVSYRLWTWSSCHGNVFYVCVLMPRVDGNAQGMCRKWAVCEWFQAVYSPMTMNTKQCHCTEYVTLCGRAIIVTVMCLKSVFFWQDWAVNAQGMSRLWCFFDRFHMFRHTNKIANKTLWLQSVTYTLWTWSICHGNVFYLRVLLPKLNGKRSGHVSTMRLFWQIPVVSSYK